MRKKYYFRVSYHPAPTPQKTLLPEDLREMEMKQIERGLKQHGRSNTKAD